MLEVSDIEIRPCFGVEDFAPPDPTGQLRQDEQALAERINTMSEDEAAIRRLTSKWSDALEAKDVDGLVADYADDAVVFDAIPPYKTVGKEAIRQVWANCLLPGNEPMPVWLPHVREGERAVARRSLQMNRNLCW